MFLIYTPFTAEVIDIVKETPDIKTIRWKPLKNELHFKPGQFVEFSVFGIGESPFCISSSPTRSPLFECSIKRLGKVTTAAHKLSPGDIIGIRGPYGRCFPLEELKERNLSFVGGGIGMAPLRSLLQYVIDNRKDFGQITVIYGARTVADLCYKQEFLEWQKVPALSLILTVDPGGEDENWQGEIGFVPTVLEKVNPKPDKAKVITCGPTIMIKFTLATLTRLGFAPEDIITTLEMKMKCGVGKCGRCNIGRVYVCKDGPVFKYSEIKELPNEF